MNRRRFAMLAAAAPLVALKSLAAQTPEVIREPVEVYGKITLDHYRIVEPSPGSSVLVGALVNRGRVTRDVPMGATVAAIDRDGTIIDSGSYFASLSVLPPSEPIGVFVEFRDADAQAVHGIRVAEPAYRDRTTGARKAMEEVDLEVSPVTEVTEDRRRQFTCEVTNRGDARLDRLDARVEVWTSDGIFGGSCYGHIEGPLLPGETVRFTTRDYTAGVNPFIVDDYTTVLRVKPW